jgi:RNA polymerase sigma-70 factor (ECF subfamily)
MSVAHNFEALVTPHLPDLRRFCFSLTKSKWEAEDLYQEALLKTLIYFRNTESDRITKSFLFSAARLLWIDGLRKGRNHEALPEIMGQALDIDYVEIRSILEWLAERIPIKNMELWLLSEYFGYSLKDIASKLDTSVPAVKSALFRTKRLIRSQRPYRKPKSGATSMCQPAVERWVKAVIWEKPQQLTI